MPGTSVDNIDYNNLTAGLHYCGANCTNAPENYCRVLCIYSYEANRNDGIQIAFAVLSSKIYRRKYSNSAGWTEWTTFSDDATIFVGTAIQSGDDLNDYKTPGIYRSISSGVTATLLNMPEIFSSGFTMLVFNMSIATNIQVIFAGDKIYMRFSNTSGWQTWFKYSGTIISS